MLSNVCLCIKKMFDPSVCHLYNLNYTHTTNLTSFILQDQNKIDKLQAAKLKPKTQKERQDGETGADGDGTNEDETMEVSGEKVETSTVGRGLESSFHTAMDRYNHYDRQVRVVRGKSLNVRLQYIMSADS